MQIIDNVSQLLGDDLKSTMVRGSRVRIAASCFSIFAFEALKAELSKVDSLQFVFTSPTFVPNEVTDRFRKERREFFIPKAKREVGLYGTEFEIQLRNKLTQRALARECAEWIRKKATFRSNTTKAPMQQFMHVADAGTHTAYMPISGFTAVDLGYQKGDAVSNFVVRADDQSEARKYLQLFDQIWADDQRVQDVTDAICDHIESVYQENSPERIYLAMLYNIFREFLEELDEDVLPNDLTGYRDSLVWNKLFNFQKDAATGIINKLETYNGCILADSVGLGKTFTALAVIKYYELRNRSVLVLCPKKLADNWRNYNSNLTTNIFAKDRFGYDVLCHTDLSRTSGESFGIPLNRVNWGNYDLVVIDESHNFRNNDVFKDRETRYQKLMNKVIRSGVKTKVLMLSATPVNNRFTDLRNQLALAYEGQSDELSRNLKTQTSVEEIFRRAQKAFNEWSLLPPDERTAASILKALDFDFFELLDAVTIARSRKHIETFYDTSEIGRFPERLKPQSFHRPITERADVMGFNDIFRQLSVLKLAVYAPISYILPSRLRKYEEIYDTQVEGGRGKLRQADREQSLKALMTTNLLKRLESSVEAFRLTLRSLGGNISRTLGGIEEFERTGKGGNVTDHLGKMDEFDPDDDDLEGLDEFSVGKKVQISLADMDLPSFKHDLAADLALTQLTRQTVADILRQVQPVVFAQFKANPEHFISEAARIVTEQKAATVIERLTYDETGQHHDVSIFTKGQTGQDFSRATDKLKNHVYDYAIVDSKVERDFVADLDTSAEVVVYAKLPKGFLIPTPVGDYNPDWAISFKAGSVRHIYFVAETKGTMGTLALRGLESSKINCARKYFDELNRSLAAEKVRYDVVTDYAKLLGIVGLAP